MKSKRKKNVRTKRFTKKTKQKQKSKKNKKTRKKKYGGKILGFGKDGCIIDSVSCGNFSKQNGYVVKMLYDKNEINHRLQNKLEELDPNNEKYNRYYLEEMKNCDKEEDYNDDFKNCSKKGKIISSNLFFQKKLDPFVETTKMTKGQWRYLRNSLFLLHDNNISHGDLVGNVMMDTTTNNPVIIDWENAKMDADELDKEIDTTTFLKNFKIRRKPL